MVIESIITSSNKKGCVNCAPIGIHLDNAESICEDEIVEVFLYEGSKTRENLEHNNIGVINFTDNAELFVNAALFNQYLPNLCFDKGGVAYLAEAKIIWGFSVISRDEQKNPGRFVLKINYCKVLAPMIFSRAFAAIIEATIAATRFPLFNQGNIADNWQQWQSIVIKTGGHTDKIAFNKIADFLEQHGCALPIVK